MFKFQTPFLPKGDQPSAIEKLTRGCANHRKSQVLLGITGSGKTFTMANVIAQVQRPTLILAHNKTLAAQLYQEFKAFFPQNAVEYFVSYYDYYQPEAYIPRTDTYIEKERVINDQIDRMRLSATRSLIEREDVIIIASVSCIYGLGLPEYYIQMQLLLSLGNRYQKEVICLQLMQMSYKRSDLDLARASFRIRGEMIEIMPAYEEDLAYRIEFAQDLVERISGIDPLTGKIKSVEEQILLFPGSHHVTPKEVKLRAIETIQEELAQTVEFFQQQGKHLQAQRILERTRQDVEMLKETGNCKGIENYSRHFSGRQAGEPPPCLIDYFPQNFLLFVDESHQTLPQIHAMYHGDRSRKNSLVEFGFRLPSAYDNRPLKFEEFYRRIHQVVYVSATPGQWEVKEANGEVVQQVIRPTGLLDPIILMRPALNQVDDGLQEIRRAIDKNNRVLVTVLTKKLAEEFTHYLVEIGISANYLHSDVDTLERVATINDLRRGKIDVLVGINLLREGLDIPEVSLVLIFDADKEGFLRSDTALIQTCGRAARNVEGCVIMYADRITKSIQRTLDITRERRILQESHNQRVGIVPQSTRRAVLEGLMQTFGEDLDPVEEEISHHLSFDELTKKAEECEKKMRESAKNLLFEEAVRYRDLLKKYRDFLTLKT